MGLPRDLTTVGAEGSRMREGATRDSWPSLINVACISSH